MDNAVGLHGIQPTGDLEHDHIALLQLLRIHAAYIDDAVHPDSRLHRRSQDVIEPVSEQFREGQGENRRDEEQQYHRADDIQRFPQHRSSPLPYG